MHTLLEQLGAVAKWVGYVAGAIVALAGCWRIASRYIEFRNTRKGIERVKLKLQNLGIVTPQAIADFVKHIVDKGVEKPSGPDSAGKRLTCAPDTGKRISAALVELMSSPTVPSGKAAMRSAIVISLDFLQDVLSTLHPIRKAGEGVARDEEGWVLERLLGIDRLSEIWLGIREENRGAQMTAVHQCRVFRFFTKDATREKILQALRDLNSTLVTLGIHPHIVHFHHVAVYDDRIPYIAMEFVPGGSLDEWIIEKQEQRVPLRKQEIIRGIVSALAKAHENGIYHRDLSPRKVLLNERFQPEERNKRPRDYDVQAKIADFGLADIIAGALASLSLTSNNSTSAPSEEIFAARYVPPEADQGGQRSPAQDDVFALGVIWYQLLTERMERPPYDFAERLREQGEDDPTIARILRCLAHPDRRYKNARQLEDDLDTSILPNWPEWPPTPQGLFDVSHLVRDYISALG